MGVLPPSWSGRPLPLHSLETLKTSSWIWWPAETLKSHTSWNNEHGSFGPLFKSCPSLITTGLWCAWVHGSKFFQCAWISGWKLLLAVNKSSASFSGAGFTLIHLAALAIFMYLALRGVGYLDYLPFAWSQWWLPVLLMYLCCVTVWTDEFCMVQQMHVSEICVQYLYSWTG